MRDSSTAAVVSRRAAWLGLCVALALGCVGSGAQSVIGVPDARTDGGVPDARTDGGAAGDRPDVRVAGPDALVSGLSLVGLVMIPLDHAIDVEAVGDHAIVATSFSAITSVRVAGAQLTIDWQQPPRLNARGDVDFNATPRCTRIAQHAPSHTIYCVALDVPGVDRYDVSAPALPVLRTDRARTYGTDGYADVAVGGDSLLVAAADGSVQAAPIGPDGVPGAWTAVTAPGRVHRVSAAGDTAVALDLTRGVLLLRRREGRWSEAGVLPIEAPLLDVDLDAGGGLAAVALGSEGLALVAVSDAGLSLTSRSSVPLVVWGVRVHDRIVAGSTPAGLLAWDARPPSPRLFGFVPSPEGTTDAVWMGDRLLEVAWTRARLYDVRREGDVTNVDAPPGYSFGSGRSISFEVRNLGERPLAASAVRPNFRCPPSCEQQELVETVAPHGSALMNFGAQSIDGWRTTDGWAFLVVMADQGRREWIGDDLYLTLTSRHSRTEGRAELGRPFPVLMPTSSAPAPVLPLAGRATRVSFLIPDCAMQWPQVTDLAWLGRHGRVPGGATPVFIHTGTLPAWEDNALMRRLGAEDFGMVPLTRYLPPIAPGNLASVSDIFEARFGTLEVRGAGVTAEFTVDAQGIVRDHERVYYGAHPHAVAVGP